MQYRKRRRSGWSQGMTIAEIGRILGRIHRPEQIDMEWTPQPQIDERPLMANTIIKPALSISAIDMLSKCGEQYRRRYIEREYYRPGVALLVGKGVDASVNANLQRKIDTRQLLLFDEAVAIARDTFEHEWTSQEVALLPEEVDAGVKVTKGAGIDKTVRLAGLHARDAAPAMQPTAVQRKWRIELPNFPMDLVGVTDIEEGATVRDTKTSAKSPREDEAHLSNQLTLYAIAKRVLDKTPGTVKVALDYLVDLKTPKLVTRESERSNDDFNVMLRRIEVAERAIERGVFVPARQSDWWCSERWCGFARTCPYFRRPVSVAVGAASE
jgi:hypothetical protein